jgi:hypothetical protein
MKTLFASVAALLLLLGLCGTSHAATSAPPSMTDTAILVGVTPIPTRSAGTVKTKAKKAATDKMNALAPTTAEATAPTTPVMPSVQLLRPTIATPAISGDNTNAIIDINLGNLLNSKK